MTYNPGWGNMFNVVPKTKSYKYVTIFDDGTKVHKICAHGHTTKCGIPLKDIPHQKLMYDLDRLCTSCKVAMDQEARELDALILGD